MDEASSPRSYVARMSAATSGGGVRCTTRVSLRSPGLHVRSVHNLLQRPGAEGVAGLDGALLIAGHEPALALFSRAMGERVRHHAAGSLALQGVVADRRRRGQRGIDIAGVEEVALLLLPIDPDTGETIRLQLDLDLKRIGFRLAASLLLQAGHARQDAEQVLDVMPGFVGDDIGGGEFARAAGTAAEAGLDLAEEAGVEEDLLVGRAIEWPHRRLRHAAAPTIGGIAEQHDARTGVALAAGLENLAPAIVDFTEHAGDHAAHVILRRSGLRRTRPAVGLIARSLAAAAGEDFRPPDQDARIDADRPADQAEHDHGSNAEAAASAHRKAEAASSTTHPAAAVVAAVVDVVAATEVIVAHGASPSLMIVLQQSATRHCGGAAKISNRLTDSVPGKNCLVPVRLALPL